MDSLISKKYRSYELKVWDDEAGSYVTLPASDGPTSSESPLGRVPSKVPNYGLIGSDGLGGAIPNGLTKDDVGAFRYRGLIDSISGLESALVVMLNSEIHQDVSWILLEAEGYLTTVQLLKTALTDAYDSYELGQAVNESLVMEETSNYLNASITYFSQFSDCFYSDSIISKLGIEDIVSYFNEFYISPSSDRYFDVMLKAIMYLASVIQFTNNSDHVSSISKDILPQYNVDGDLLLATYPVTSSEYKGAGVWEPYYTISGGQVLNELSEVLGGHYLISFDKYVDDSSPYKFVEFTNDIEGVSLNENYKKAIEGLPLFDQLGGLVGYLDNAFITDFYKLDGSIDYIDEMYAKLVYADSPQMIDTSVINEIVDGMYDSSNEPIYINPGIRISGESSGSPTEDFKILISKLSFIKSRINDTKLFRKFIEDLPNDKSAYVKVTGSVVEYTNSGYTNCSEYLSVSANGKSVIMIPDSSGIFELYIHPNNMGSSIIISFNSVDYTDKSMVIDINSLDDIIVPEVVLVKLQEVAIIDSTIENNVPFSSVSSDVQAEVIFPVGSLLSGDGSVYEGDVVIHGNFIDPESESFYDELPGSLDFPDGTNLLSYGMITVELTAVNGNELSVDPAIPATIKIPVRSDDINPAATIPLWNFNVETSTWIEEGIATYDASSNSYVGTVSHFSTWNMDKSRADFPKLDIDVVCTDGNQIPSSATESPGYIYIKINNQVRRVSTQNSTEMITNMPSSGVLTVSDMSGVVLSSINVSSNVVYPCLIEVECEDYLTTVVFNDSDGNLITDISAYELSEDLEGFVYDPINSNYTKTTRVIANHVDINKHRGSISEVVGTIVNSGLLDPTSIVVNHPGNTLSYGTITLEEIDMNAHLIDDSGFVSYKDADTGELLAFISLEVLSSGANEVSDPPSAFMQTSTINWGLDGDPDSMSGTDILTSENRSRRAKVLFSKLTPVEELDFNDITGSYNTTKGNYFTPLINRPTIIKLFSFDYLSSTSGSLAYEGYDHTMGGADAFHGRIGPFKANVVNPDSTLVLTSNAVSGFRGYIPSTTSNNLSEIEVLDIFHPWDFSEIFISSVGTRIIRAHYRIKYYNGVRNIEYEFKL